MNIKKHVFVLFFSFFLFGMVVAPKAMAETQTGVTLNGATIRTDASDGKQGLRFKITVTNNNCSITSGTHKVYIKGNTAGLQMKYLKFTKN